MCIKNQIDLTAILFYLGAIFWTLGFDTIYGYQDIKDDEIIGVKSTSIKFKKNPKLFLIICYLVFTIWKNTDVNKIRSFIKEIILNFLNF